MKRKQARSPSADLHVRLKQMLHDRDDGLDDPLVFSHRMLQLIVISFKAILLLCARDKDGINLSSNVLIRDACAPDQKDTRHFHIGTNGVQSREGLGVSRHKAN